MNIKLVAAIGIVITTIVIGAGIAVTLSSDQPSTPQPTTTTVTTSTATTPAKQDTPTREVKKSTKSTALTESKGKGASYQTFSEAAFRAATDGSSRVLFFYDSAHAPSAAIDTFIKSHVEILPDTLHIYRVSLPDNKELAEQVGVTTPGTALKYDSESRMTHVYVAPENPTFEGFVKNLALDN